MEKVTTADFIMKICQALVPGIIIAIATAVMTVQLSLKKFRAEKIWEKKFDSYSSILKAFSVVKNEASIVVNHAKDHGVKPWEDVNNEVYKKYAETAEESAALLEESLNIGALLISKEAYDLLSDFGNTERPEASLDWKDPSIFFRELDRLMQEFIILAKKDLGMDLKK